MASSGSGSGLSDIVAKVKRSSKPAPRYSQPSGNVTTPYAPPSISGGGSSGGASSLSEATSIPTKEEAAGFTELPAGINEPTIKKNPTFQDLRSSPFGEFSKEGAAEQLAQQTSASRQTIKEAETVAKESSPFTSSGGSSKPSYQQLRSSPYGEFSKAGVAEELAQKNSAIKRLEAEAPKFDPFFTKEGQKQRLQNIPETYKQIGSNLFKGRILTPIPVTPEYRETLIGDIGTAISRPLNVLGLPAGIAAGSTFLIGLGGAFEVGASAATRGSESILRRKYTAEERELLKGINPVLKSGFQQAGISEYEKIQFNQDVDEILKQKNTFDLQVRGEAKAAGLTGQEYANFLKQNEKAFSNSVIDAFRRQGKTAEESKYLAGLAIQGQKQETGKIFNIPFSNKVISSKAILGEISLLFTDTKAFEKGARDYLNAQGITGKQQEKVVELALKERGVRGVGEIAALASVEIGSEISGQGFFRNIAKGLQRKGAKLTRGELFIQGAKATAPAGFLEGYFGVQQQRKIRLEAPSVKEQLIAGGIGAASAGTLGGAIIATRPANKLTSKVLSGFGRVLDPYESIGDITAAGSKRIAKATGTKVARTPPIITLSSKAPAFSFSPAEVKAPKISTGVPTSTKTQTTTRTTVNLNTLVEIPAEVQEGRIQTNLNLAVESLIPSNVPSPSENPTPVNPFIPVQVPSNVPTNVNINTPTNVNTNVPVFTPRPTLPPPLPLLFPAGSGGFGARKGKKTKFINELEIGKKLLADLTAGSGGLRRLSKPKPKKKTKRKKRK